MPNDKSSGIALGIVSLSPTYGPILFRRGLFFHFRMLKNNTNIKITITKKGIVILYGLIALGLVSPLIMRISYEVNSCPQCLQ